MEFASVKKETVILNPKKDMAKRTIPSEIRTDPLTGRSARICHFMKLQWEKPDFDALAAGTQGTCPFCPERVMSWTPCFPPEIAPEGRIVSGDMVLFPNIAPYDCLGAVVTMGAEHFIPMTGFEPRRIAEAFGVAAAFFNRLEKIGHPEAVYHLINWNYMPPSGSTIVHPHLQIFSTASAPNLMREELSGAKAYHKSHGTNYWDDLVSAETASGKRYLAAIGRTTWLSAYAPMGVAGDVLAVVDGARSTLDLTETDLFDLSDGLCRVMAAYDNIGIYSFNMNFFTGTGTDAHARFHLLFSPRTFFNQALGTPDNGALRNLYNETVCMAFPEDIAGMLRPSFEAEF
jgi:UDPglucose--hexose-1-phosphate uridylyltransferase